ncbi:MAG: phosphatidate cytidylyltransferase [Pirellulales bacterium]|nr:phosphatidate cytidylyltransferase [Pirellulales bacterium]
MLVDRLKTSAVLVTIVAVLIYLDAGTFRPGTSEGLWLVPLLLFFSLGTAWDISNLLLGSGRSINRKMTLLATLLITLSACLPQLWAAANKAYPPNCPVGELGWIVIAAVLGVFLILLSEMRQYGKEGSTRKGTIERTCAGTFVSLYVGLPMALLVCLRSMGTGNWGLAALLTMVAVTKSADAGAYFAGKSFGKHKLVPRLSPGKTWEGLLGGVVTATIVAFVCLRWLFPAISQPGTPPTAAPSIAALSNPIWAALVMGPLLTMAGLVGDLAESLVKRDCGAKDSGSLLPGLGGVWDVTDSLIAAIMPAFLCFAAGAGSG